MIGTALADRPRLERGKNAVRYASRKHFDDTTGVINGSAFDRTPKDHDGLSFTERLKLSRDPVKDESAIRRVVGSRLALGKTACFAELNVGHALEALTQFEQNFYFCEDPLPEEGDCIANPAHALLIGLPFAGEAVGSLKSELAGDLLRRIILRTFPAVSPS